MKLAYLFCLTMAVASAGAAQSQGDIERELDEIARVGTVMVDGDLCPKIVTERALKAMFEVDPRDPWVAGDNYEVDDAAFIATKKTLMRLARLASFRCDVNLWVPLAGHPGKIHVAVRNVNELSQFWVWGELAQDMMPSMKTVLETGKRLTVTEKPGWVSVLAPVYDSLGDVVGVLEVVTQTRFDAHANVK
jgi:hypothetical protein